MNTTIIVLILLPLISAWLFSMQNKNKLKHRDANKEAMNEAIVLQITATGLYYKNGQQVKMLVQVFPQQGRNFVAEIMDTLTTEELVFIKEGTKVAVCYSGRDNKLLKLILPLPMQGVPVTKPTVK
jgi:hypothetical protein